MGCLPKSSLDKLWTGVLRFKRIYAIADPTIYVEGIYGEDGTIGAV
jgi:hypothetical protein